MEWQPPCPIIIIDSGTGFMKAGFSGPHALPTVITPCSENILRRQFLQDESWQSVEREKRASAVNFESLEKVTFNLSKIVIKSVLYRV